MQCIIRPREQAPDGYAWVDKWRIDFSHEVDAEGFQYANDINREFKPVPVLATLRRRRWKRTCQLVPEQ